MDEPRFVDCDPSQSRIKIDTGWPDLLFLVVKVLAGADQIQIP